jgi:hypothetical protein
MGRVMSRQYMHPTEWGLPGSTNWGLLEDYGTLTGGNAR